MRFKQVEHRKAFFVVSLIFVAGAVFALHGIFSGKISGERFREGDVPGELNRASGSKKESGAWFGGKRNGRSDSAEEIGRRLANGKCSGSGPGRLTRSAMDADDFTMIIPYGLMTGGHVTPIDHQYYAPADYDSPRDAYPVYAMGDARLIFIEHRTGRMQDNAYVRAHESDEYRLVFSQTCTSFYYYDLLTSLTPEIERVFERASRGRRTAVVDIPVRAGDLIGRIGGQTLDFAVWDTEKPLGGFAVPEHYESEPWKLYTADPLDYYAPELKTFMLARYPRTVEPLSGKIDWDIDGTLRGNWFLKGTDYAGDLDDRARYWKTHLAFAPDLYDPSRFVISLGDFAGEARQFNARGNAPDPVDVRAESGLVKYELVHGEYVTPDGRPWDRKTFVKGPRVRLSDNVVGTVLVELLDARTLRFEAFPGKRAREVRGFTADAKIYTR